MSPLTFPTQTVDIVDIRQNDVGFSLVNDIHKGIDPSVGPRRSMPTMLLYDSKGLNLFEEITYLDEYYPTNAEIQVLETHAKSIVERIPNNGQLLELGSGYALVTLITRLAPILTAILETFERLRSFSASLNARENASTTSP